MAANDWTGVLAGKVVTNANDYVEQMVTGHLTATPAAVFQRSFKYDGTQAGLERVVNAVLNVSDKTASTQRTAVAPGTPLNVADLVPPDPTPPTPAEAARAAFAIAYQRVLGLQRAQSAKLSAITQQTVDNAVQALNALPYLPEYEGLL